MCMEWNSDPSRSPQALFLIVSPDVILLQWTLLQHDPGVRYSDRENRSNWLSIKVLAKSKDVETILPF